MGARSLSRANFSYKYVEGTGVARYKAKMRRVNSGSEMFCTGKKGKQTGKIRTIGNGRSCQKLYCQKTCLNKGIRILKFYWGRLYEAADFCVRLFFICLQINLFLLKILVLIGSYRHLNKQVYSRVKNFQTKLSMVRDHMKNFSTPRNHFKSIFNKFNKTEAI